MARDPKATFAVRRMTRASHRAALFTIVLAAFFSGGVLAASSPASAATPAPGLQAICELARQLSENSADDALAYIDANRAGAKEGSAAEGACEGLRLSILFDQANEGLQKPQTTADPPPADLEKLCTLATKLAKTEPQKALDLIKKLRDTSLKDSDAEKGCEDARIAAIRELVAQENAPTASEQASESWAGGFGDWLLPLAGIMTAIFGTVLAALILARLLVLIPADISKSRIVREVRNAKVRIRLIWVGLTLIVAGAIILPLGISVLSLWGSAPVVVKQLLALVAANVVAVSVVVLALGIVRLARALASTLALNITVNDNEGKPDDARRAAIIAHLSSLGSNNPTGLEIPEATDVTALAEAALPSSTNAVLSALKSVVTTLIGISPWRITVNSITEAQVVVLISRNGHAVSSTMIDAEQWKSTLGDISLDPDKIAAALVLKTIADRYTNFVGFNGAKDWSSIGLHYIATTDFATEPEKMKKILPIALDIDHNNLAASVALKHTLYRNASNAAELAHYCSWLSARSADLDSGRSLAKQERTGVIDLHRRILFNYVIAVLNLRATEDSQLWRPKDEVQRNALRLKKLIKVSTPRSAVLREQMRGRVRAPFIGLMSLYQIDGLELSKDVSGATAPSPNDPVLGNHIAYNSACLLVSEGKTMDDLDLVEKLEIAVQEPEIKKMARKDPSLLALRGDSRFATLLGVTPDTDFWSLDLFAPHSKTLKDLGITQPSQLHLQPNGKYFQSKLGLVDPHFDSLVRASQLVDAVERASWLDRSNSASAARVNIAAELIDLDIDDPAKLGYARPGSEIRATILTRTAAKVAEDSWLSIDREDLASWLRLVRKNWRSIQ